MENKTQSISIDSISNGLGQVSSYIAERKVSRYVKNKLKNEQEFIKRESTILSASSEYILKMYDRLQKNGNISIKELFAPLPKKKIVKK